MSDEPKTNEENSNFGHGEEGEHDKYYKGEYSSGDSDKDSSKKPNKDKTK